jgi:hypothetical protein
MSDQLTAAAFEWVGPLPGTYHPKAINLFQRASSDFASQPSIAVCFGFRRSALTLVCTLGRSF